MLRRLLLTLCLLLISTPVFAASFDPGAHWRTLKTPHFQIHYPEQIADTAQRAASILEEIYPKVREEWDWKPWGRTEVVLTDSTDESNGMTSVLPYNWMLIFVAPPDPDSSLAHYDDWLRTLLLHEFTHLVQIDAVGGIWRGMRYILGKTVAPSGMNPMWYREGVAQYGETDFTAGGRGRGAYSEMVVRADLLANDFPAIDEADGMGWRWPSAKGAYIYGIKFVQWLVATYGEDRFKEYDRQIRSTVLLGMLNHDARKIYGKTLYELWKEWQASLQERYAQLKAELEQKGITEPAEIVVPTGRDGQYSDATLSPDGTKLVYTATSPHGPAEIRLLDLTNGETEVLKKKQTAVQYSWSPDGTKIVYAAIGRTKSNRYRTYYDLWLCDLNESKEKKRFRTLTQGSRARDPEFDRTGESVFFVAGEQGADLMQKIDIDSKEITILTRDVPPNQQFANPRLSPDGRELALSVWKPGEGYRVWIYTADGVPVRRLTQDKGIAIEARPVWSKEGGEVIFSSDQSGISNFYRSPRTGGHVEQLTNVMTGVFQPQLVSDHSLYAQYYTNKGFVIARFEVTPLASSGKAKGAKTLKGEKGTSEVLSLNPAGNEIKPVFGSAATTFPTSTPLSTASPALDPSLLSEKKYSALGKSLFLPRFILPNAAYANDTFFASLTTGGTDVLRWHTWLASVSYRTDANYLGYSFRYAYSRYRPTLGVIFADYAVDMGNVVFVYTNNVSRVVHLYEKRRAVAPYITFPFQKHAVTLAYYYEDHRPKTSLTPGEQAALNFGKFAGFRAEYVYGDSELYPAAISKENGRNIHLIGSITNHIFGTSEGNEQVIFSGDWREYVRLWHHHVLALRAAGGTTWGDRLAQGSFGLGGAVGEGAFGGGGSYNYFPLRGLPVSAFSGNSAMLLSAEYRLPLYSPLRGLGTTPFFLKDISTAFFADFGNAWTGSVSFKDFFDPFLLGVGTELRGNFIIGHGLPVHGRIGYGIIVKGRDRLFGRTDPLLGTNLDYGTFILAFGASF